MWSAAGRRSPRAKELYGVTWGPSISKAVASSETWPACDLKDASRTDDLMV